LRFAPESRPPPDQEFLHHGAAAAFAPQPLEQQGAPIRRHFTSGRCRRHQRHNHRSLRQPARPGGAVEIAARFDHLLASEIADDALFGLAVLSTVSTK
jgi:hypothetical protein